MARVLLAKARYTTLDQSSVVPPLGPMYLASVLREAGHQVRIYESGYQWRNLIRFRQALEDFRPDVLGISAITFEAKVMDAMADEAKDVFPDMPIIVGGPHPSAYPERCAQHPSIDFAVVGEGEVTCLELVNALTRGGQSPETVAGTVFVDGEGKVAYGPPRAAIEDLDAIPFPAWDLIDIEFYARSKAMSTMGRRRYMGLFTSRGCPYRCIYCHEVQGKRFRARSPQNVLAEMRALKQRHGIREFEVIDDIFNLDKARMKEVLGEIIASDFDPRLHFPNALRTDLLDEEQIRLLRQAGTHFLCVAVETVSHRLQRLIKKRLRVERVRENIDHAVREGMFVNGFFMLGFPTETYEEARETVEWALRTPLHQALFFIVTPFAGTGLYDMFQDVMQERGVPDQLENLEYFKGSYNLSEMTDEQLFGLQREGYRRFFADPARVGRIIARHPRRRHLFNSGMQTLVKMLPRRRGNDNGNEAGFITGRSQLSMSSQGVHL